MNNYIYSLIENLVGKKIMIAGFNGYIGTELVHQLELNNFPYIGIDKIPSSNNNCFNFNLTDKEKVIEIISIEKPDYFIHMATHSALAYKNDFLNVFNEDSVALNNIILGLKKSKNTRLVYFSSSYVYSGLDSNKNVNEKTILSPTHNFGLAKSFFEQLISRVYPDTIIFRLSSVFGKGKYLHPNAIEVMAQEAMNDKLLTVWGKGARRMQYIFIQDVIKYILNVKEMRSGIYNLGGHSYNTVMETANYIADYYSVKTKTLPDKKEGETLPSMKNDKVIDEIAKDYFSDYKVSLNQFLNDISRG